MVAITPLLLSLSMNAVLAEKFYALNYSPYRTTKTCASDAEIQQDLEIVKDMTNMVKIDVLGECEHETQVLKIASGLGMQVIMQLPFNDQAMFSTQLEVLKKTISATSEQEHLAIQSVIVGQETFGGLSAELLISSDKEVKAFLDSDPTLSHVKLNQAQIDGDTTDPSIIKIDNFVMYFPITLVNLMAGRANVTENLEGFTSNLVEYADQIPKNIIFSKWGWPSTLRDIKTNEDLSEKYAETAREAGYIPNSDKILINTMLCDPQYRNLTIMWDDAFDRDWDYQEEDGFGMAFRNLGMGFANRTLKPGVKEAMSCTSTQ